MVSDHSSSTYLARRTRMNAYHILYHLIPLERRVRDSYRFLSERPQSSPTLRAVWQAMAEDETHHLVALERSAYVCDVMEHPPSISDDVLTRMEAVVAAAEAVIHNPSLTENEALCG